MYINNWLNQSALFSYQGAAEDSTALKKSAEKEKASDLNKYSISGKVVRAAGVIFALGAAMYGISRLSLPEIKIEDLNAVMNSIDSQDNASIENALRKYAEFVEKWSFLGYVPPPQRISQST